MKRELKNILGPDPGAFAVPGCNEPNTTLLRSNMEDDDTSEDDLEAETPNDNLQF